MHCNIEYVNCFQMIKLILIFICVKLGHGWPSSAPPSACDTMMPEHGVLPQNTTPPYYIKSSASVYGGDDINGNIKHRRKYFKHLICLWKNPDRHFISLRTNIESWLFYHRLIFYFTKTQYRFLEFRSL